MAVQRRKKGDVQQQEPIEAGELDQGRSHVTRVENGPRLRDEWDSALLLVVLYMIQGVPLGLSMGSMPFLMRSTMSYTQIGIFTLAGYPYSFKLFWSPIVDSIYWRSVGRRKSWILPLQAAAAAIMLTAGGWLEQRLHARDAVSVTALFFVLVMLAATQDIAVDGWALTLLSKRNVGYAATCQTVGMNIGFFSSFTVFLALNDPEFCASVLGTAPGAGPVVTLAGYLRFWGLVYLAVTLALALFKTEGGSGGSANGSTHENGAANGLAAPAEDPPPQATGTRQRRRSLRLAGKPAELLEDGEVVGGDGAVVGDSAGRQGSAEGSHEGGEEDLPLGEAYAQLWRVVRLPSVRLLAVVLVVCRLGMLTAESASALKLLEKGASKEALAGLVLVEFPIELVSALLAGKWAASAHPFRPWLVGYRLRLALAAATTAAVWAFPTGASALSDAPACFALLAALGVATSFASTLMFTALGDYYNRISDPGMGGAYLTLLNTLANVGVVVPKLGVFAAMDALTLRKCVGGGVAAACGPASAGGAADGACVEAGGRCVVGRDGFYVLSALSVALGAGILVWLHRVLPRLEQLPPSAWRAPLPGGPRKQHSRKRH